jgi:hypothetical protein
VNIVLPERRKGIHLRKQGIQEKTEGFHPEVCNPESLLLLSCLPQRNAIFPSAFIRVDRRLIFNPVQLPNPVSMVIRQLEDPAVGDADAEERLLPMAIPPVADQPPAVLHVRDVIRPTTAAECRRSILPSIEIHGERARTLTHTLTLTQEVGDPASSNLMVKWSPLGMLARDLLIPSGRGSDARDE